MTDPEGVRPTDLPRITPHDALRAIEQRFGPAQSGRLFCPVHEADGGRHTPDFTAKVQGDKLVVHCFANCPQDAVVGELKSLGMWPTPPPRERNKPLRTWTWWTTNGRKRKMNEWEINGRKKKIWSKKRPDSPAPRDLLYVQPRDGFPKGPAPIIFTEGPTSTDALDALGFRAVGVQGGKTTAESLARFDPKAPLVYWPDHDASGYTQMDRFVKTAAAAGFKVQAVDPLRINLEAPRKFDARDWQPGDHVSAELEQAIVDVDALDDRPRQGYQVVNDWKSAQGFERVLEAIGWRHRRNVRAGTDEIQQDDGEWAELTDQVECLARTTLIPAKCHRPAGDDETKPLEIGRDTFYAGMNAHGALTSVDPFLEWLETLPAWDGQHRNWINGCFPSTVDDELADWAGTATLVACIRLAHKPGDQQDETVVLAGDQKAGKTSAIIAMFPPGAGDDWYDLAPPMDAKEQVLKERVRGPVVMEFGELAGSSRADLARVKGWLTARKDRGRDAFARNVTSAKRRCITMGTIDQNDALPIDPAGNRRWVVLPLEEGEGHKKHVVRWWAENRDQAWAEALQLFHAGHPHHLPDALGGKQAHVNEQYRRRDEVVEGALEAYLVEWSTPSEVVFADACEAVRAKVGQVHNLSGRVTLALKVACFRSGRVKLPNGETVRRWTRQDRGVTGVVPGVRSRAVSSKTVAQPARIEKTPVTPLSCATEPDPREPVGPEPVRLDQGEAANARDVAWMADILKPEQPHVDRTGPLGSPFYPKEAEMEKHDGGYVEVPGEMVDELAAQAAKLYPNDKLLQAWILESPGAVMVSTTLLAKLDSPRAES